MRPFPPMLATLSRGVVSGAEWVFEEKYDGIRLLAFRDGSRVRLFSRNLIDRTGSWPDVARAIAALPGGDLVLDGEVFAFDRMRVSRFQLLQQRAHSTFAAFDLPVLDGRSLMRRPLAERRDALESRLAGAKAPLKISRRLAGSGERAYAVAQERQWEGIIAKRVDSTYQPGVRSPDWLKVKVRHQSEFVIGGWTPPAGARSDFGALLVGLFDGDRLRFTGKVGTGFTRGDARGAWREARAPRDEARAVRSRSAVPRRALGTAATRRAGRLCGVDRRRQAPPAGVPRAAHRQGPARLPLGGAGVTTGSRLCLKALQGMPASLRQFDPEGTPERPRARRRVRQRRGLTRTKARRPLRCITSRR